jgi:mannose-6-phosphate isomerase-like protein (cupin superfamily)
MSESMTGSASDQAIVPIALRAPLLASGIMDTPVFQTELMWMHLKVYAAGGENDLHCHPKEEHCFIVLEGEATFYDRDGAAHVAQKWEGVLLPKGALYRFHSTGAGNLVMLRIGTGSNNHLLTKRDERRGPDGKPLPYNPSQIAKGRVQPVEIPGAFFGFGGSTSD